MRRVSFCIALQFLVLYLIRSTYAQNGPLPDLQTIWPLRKSSVVLLTVSGKDALGNPVSSTKGFGVLISSQGHILTALHVIGLDSNWSSDPDGISSRKIQVRAFTDDGLKDL